MKNDKSFGQIFKENIITISILAGTISVGYFNLVTASKLSPIEQNQSVIIQRVNALEKKTEGLDLLVEPIGVMKNDIGTLKDNIASYEKTNREDHRAIEDKLDKLLIK